MHKINISKYQYLYRHLYRRYANLNNVVIAIAFLIALSWAWGSIGMMERNYKLQQQVYVNQQKHTLAQLEVDTLKYQHNYYQTDEYKELSLRQHLGEGKPGEKLLILPPNSVAAKQVDAPKHIARSAAPRSESNFQQWMDFLGGSPGA